MNDLSKATAPTAPVRPFSDPHWTASGEPRAQVDPGALRTLWFNTGTLCNIECAHCYIRSSPTNDALVYLTLAEVEGYIDEIAIRGLPTEEIGFTGGEPFMNPEVCDMAEVALDHGHRVLILTNAMRPMMRPRVQERLAWLARRHGTKLVLRVSLDHYTAELHNNERGADSFDAALRGMRWLRDAGISISIAGRTRWGESEDHARAGYARLSAAEGLPIDAHDPAGCVLFPEMDEAAEVPEITTRCWDILGKSPESVMCASARMVVKRTGADRPVVLACTLVAYDPAFELGETLAEAERPVPLNHPHCARFCVLGGASCSG